MNLLVFTHHYTPERTGIGPLIADLSEEMVRRGHSVTVLTGFPAYPEWRVHEGYRGKWYQREEIHGVNVRRSYTYAHEPRPAIHRVLYDSSVAASCLPNVPGVPRPDLLITVSVPLQPTVTGIVLNAWWRAPLLMIIQDIVPDVAIDVGMMKNPHLIRVARRLEQFCYRNVSHIAVICEGFKRNLLKKGVPEGKLSVITNWVDTGFVRPLERMGPFRARHGIGPETFVALYSGNMSVWKQGLSNILHAAESFKDDPGVRFILTGDGPDKANLMALAREKGLANVLFCPFEPRETFPEMLAAADVLLVNERADVRDTVLPSKFLTYMAAGRPIAAAVHEDSETALYLRMAECGPWAAPENPAALAEALRSVRARPIEAARMARNGRAFAERNFARDAVLGMYEQTILSLAERTEAPAAHVE